MWYAFLTLDISDERPDDHLWSLLVGWSPIGIVQEIYKARTKARAKKTRIYRAEAEARMRVNPDRKHRRASVCSHESARRTHYYGDFSRLACIAKLVPTLKSHDQKNEQKRRRGGVQTDRDPRARCCKRKYLEGVFKNMKYVGARRTLGPWLSEVDTEDTPLPNP